MVTRASTTKAALTATIAASLVALASATASAADCDAADAGELQACIAQAQPGDVVTMAAGEFSLNNLSLTGLAGQDGAPIVIRGTLDQDGARLSHIIGQSTGSNVIDIDASSYLELRDFELSFVGGTTGNSVDLIKFGGMGDASHHILIENCELHDTGNVAISSQAREIHDIVVVANHIHDIGGSCFYWGYYEDDDPLRWAHHSDIVGNLLQRCPADDASATHYGIQLKSGSHDNLIADNVMVDIGGTSRAGIIVYHNAPKPVGEPLAGSNRITRNLLVRPRNEGINAAAGAIISNNIVIDAAGIAIFLQPRSYGGATYYGSIEVLNNTVVQTVGGAGAHGIRWTHEDWTLADPQRPSSFIGNLALVSNGADGLRPPSDTATVDANATDANDNGAANTVVIGDPLAAVASTTFGEAGYLVPVEGGPLVDGVAEPVVTLDYAVAMRDATPDIGAYEWTGELPPPLDEDAFKEALGDPGDGDGDPGDGDGDPGDGDGDPGDGDGDPGDGDGDPGDGDGDGGNDEVDEGEGDTAGESDEFGGSEDGEGCACASSDTPGGLAMTLFGLLVIALPRRRVRGPSPR